MNTNHPARVARCGKHVSGHIKHTLQWSITALLGLSAGLALVAPAWAQPQDPVESTVSSPAGSGAGDWSNPGNVVGPPDNNCANMGAVDKANLTYNFDFNIPLDATITGVTAHVKAGENGDQDIGIQLASDASVDPPTPIGDPRTMLIAGVGSGNCSATAVNTIGTTLDDWGLATLDPATVNTPEFGIVFTKLETSSVKVDAICLQITYEQDAGNQTQQECFVVDPGETATITIVKEVVGTPPDSSWAFTGSGDIGGNFTILAEGGFQTMQGLSSGEYELEETTKAGYTVTSACFIDDVLVSEGDHSLPVTVEGVDFATCVFTNTLNTGSFTVNKDFSDDSDTEVSITLTCSEGDITENPLTATEGSPAVFEVTGYTDLPTCTATEDQVPAGYTMDNSGCQDDDELGGSCTIVNTLRTANFTVNKTYNDGHTDPVTVNLSCDSGDITENDLQAAPGSPAVFEVTGWTIQAPTCTATESNVPPGHTADNADCEAVAILSFTSCTIENTVNLGTFTVRKIYTVEDPASVSVTATCTSPAVVTNNPQPASTSTSAVFNVTHVVPGETTCTATEAVPPGYTADEADCQDGDPIDGGCAITNEPVRRATFLVTKDFTDDNPSEVEVEISCFTGLPLVQSQDISETQDVEFIVESFDPGELDCDVSEVIPNGYSPTYDGSIIDGEATEPVEDASGCHFLEVVYGEFQCSIVNTPDPVDVVVEKVWVIEGANADYVDTRYELELSCDAQIVDGYVCDTFPVVEAPTAYDGTETWCIDFQGDAAAIFTGQVIPEYPTSTCSVVEHVYDDSVEIDNDCDNLVISAGSGASCVITNTVFFEGIPTLNQFGVALLALLMLGVGVVGFRRFV